MALRSGNIFYFPFSPVDQGLIDTAEQITVVDLPYAAAPALSQGYPQSLRLRFKLKNAGSPPHLRPLAPGKLRFLADVVAGKSPPDIASAIPANYASWPTTGTLLLTIDTPEVQQRLQQISGLPVVPNKIWYSKVSLPSSFLFTSLPALRKVPLSRGKKQGKTDTASAEWIKHAVSAFLKGKGVAELALGAQPTADDVAKTGMPSLVPDATGWVELLISTSFRPSPFDGLVKDYALPTGVSALEELKDSPFHPAEGAIPARLVYRSLRVNSTHGNMIDGMPGLAVPDATMPAEPQYRAVRFTRIWKPEADCSVHFPSQVVRAEQSAPGNLVFEQRLPSHGVLFVALTAIQQLGGWQFSFSIPSPPTEASRVMRWLAGDTAEAWTLAGSTTPVEQDLGLGSAHIILRRRMGQEVIYDRKERPSSSAAACTYYSLRRAVRALVNNRIAGGRLNFEVFIKRGSLEGRNLNATRKLVITALGASAAGKVLDGAPDPFVPDAQIGTAAGTLRSVLEKFFPDPVPPTSVNGATIPDPKLSYGAVAYLVWQSATGEFSQNTTTRAFHDAWLGGGGAGALVASGLAADYSVNPGQTVIRGANETRASFVDRIVDALFDANLQPGAELQWWDSVTLFDDIRARQSVTPLGHSPTFLKYDGPASSKSGIWVLDQNGPPVKCPVVTVAGKKILQWHSFNPDVWLAADWLE